MRGIQTNTMIFYALRETGALLFLPKGALTHHLQSKRWYAYGIVRSPRGMRLPQYFILLEALWTMPHLCGAAVIVHAVGSCFCICNNRQLPAKILSRTNPSDLFNSFIADMGSYTPPIFFLQKRNKNRGRKDGESEWRSTTWKQRL